MKKNEKPINIIVRISDLTPEIKQRAKTLLKEIKPEYRKIFKRQAYIIACKEKIMEDPYKNEKRQIEDDNKY